MTFEQCLGGLYLGNELRALFQAHALAHMRGFFMYNKNPNPQKLISAIAQYKEEYLSEEGIFAALDALKYAEQPLLRVCHEILLREVMLEAGDCTCPSEAVITGVLAYEQEILDRARESKVQSDARFSVYRALAATAAENESILPRNVLCLLDKCAEVLGMTARDRHIQEAINKTFPTTGQILHSTAELDTVRAELFAKGLLFSVKRADGVIFTVIPSEIASVIRKYYGCELSKRAYAALFADLYESQKKRFFTDALYDCHVEVSAKASGSQLQKLILANVRPSFLLLGGRALHKGMDRAALADFCAARSLSKAGGKTELMRRLFEYYNSLS